MIRYYLIITVTVFFMTGCSGGREYGDIGWQDSENMLDVEATNPRKDLLLAADYSVDFAEYVLLLKNTSFSGSCDESDGDKSELGLTTFEVDFNFDFPEDATQSFQLSGYLFVDKREGGEHAAAIFGEAQSLPKQASQTFASLNKLDVRLTDKCGNEVTRYFNISGDVIQLARTIEERK